MDDIHILKAKRLDCMMRKTGLTKKNLGVTLHGLRHQYLNERFEAIAGMQPTPLTPFRLARAWAAVLSRIQRCSRESICVMAMLFFVLAAGKSE